MNRILTTLTSIVFIFFAFSSCCFAESITGRCIRVSDGDTVTIQLPNGTKERIRLRGIDAPESGQDFGRVSKRELTKLISRKEVRVETDGRDRYDRIIGKIYLGQLFVNEEMVRLGVAWYYPKYTPNEPELLAAQDEAKAARRGLWVQRSPLPPWEWRKLNREGKRHKASAQAGLASAQGLYWVSKAGKIHNPSCRYYGSSNSGIYTNKPTGTDCKACGGLGR